MPQWRCTFSFGPSIEGGGLTIQTQGSQNGWSETWYNVGDTSLEQIVVIMDQLRVARRRLLTAGWRIVAARVARFPLTRQAARIPYSPLDGVGRYPQQALVGNDEQPYDALVINVTSNTGHQRAFSLRGTAREVISPGAQFLNPANFQAGYGLWFTALSNGFGLRLQNLTVKWNIQNVFLANQAGMLGSPVAPLVECLVPILPNYPPGTQVKISGVVGMAGINGLWAITRAFQGVNSSFFQLRARRGNTVYGTYTMGTGFLQGSFPILDPIATMTPSQGTSRRTGRFSPGPRGRRSRRPQ